MKYRLRLSMLLNLLLLTALVLMIHWLGGWRYAWYRFRSDQSGQYTHRSELFQRLPARVGSIIFLGDSQIEQCEWAELLHLNSVSVLNRGIVGDQTQLVLRRLAEVLRHQPRKIFLLVGINDLLLGSSVDETAGRYQQIVQQLRQQSPDTELYLMSVLPVNNDVKNIGIGNAVIQHLNQRIVEISRQYALPYLDLYGSLTDTQGRLAATWTADGIHLNGQAYAICRQMIVPYVQ